MNLCPALQAWAWRGESSSPRGLEGLETITVEGIVRGAGAGSWEWQGGSWSGVGGHSRPTFQVLVRCK